MQLIRSLLYTTWLFVGTLLYAVVVLVLAWLPPKQLYAELDEVERRLKG